jgi:glutathione S-transferase
MDCRAIRRYQEAMTFELYSWTTPNGRKPHILLEELGLPFTVHAINIGKDEQKTPAFLALNPNGRIPALVHRPSGSEPVSIFESGAILIYLAELSGRFLPSTGQARADALAWLMFQMSAVGPMFGQLGWFQRNDPSNTVAVNRYATEMQRIITVLDGALAKAPYLAGEYSIADMATYPWVQGMTQLAGLDLAPYPHVARWCESMKARPAVQAAMAWKP